MSHAGRKWDPESKIWKAEPESTKEYPRFPESNVRVNEDLTVDTTDIDWKYHENEIVGDLLDYLATTYGEHYAIEENLQCFDAMIAMGNADTTFRDTAMKYLWRYGKKEDKNKRDLFKALHYITLMLHVNHYKDT